MMAGESVKCWSSICAGGVEARRSWQKAWTRDRRSESRAWMAVALLVGGIVWGIVPVVCKYIGRCLVMMEYIMFT